MRIVANALHTRRDNPFDSVVIKVVELAAGRAPKIIDRLTGVTAEERCTFFEILLAKESNKLRAVIVDELAEIKSVELADELDSARIWSTKLKSRRFGVAKRRGVSQPVE